MEMNVPSLAEMQLASIRESMPALERMIRDQPFQSYRNPLVVRLAAVDRLAAALRDELGDPGVLV